MYDDWNWKRYMQKLSTMKLSLWTFIMRNQEAIRTSIFDFEEFVRHQVHQVWAGATESWQHQLSQLEEQYNARLAEKLTTQKKWRRVNRQVNTVKRVRRLTPNNALLVMDLIVHDFIFIYTDSLIH